MDLTIAGLRNGAKLVFGKYGCTGNACPITWLKTGKDTEFLSEFVLDLLKFDGSERDNPDRQYYYNGNACYAVSNILQFLNSSEEDWYSPMHEYDAPPGVVGRQYDARGDYLCHSGFLNDFEDYELDCIDGFIELPTAANIVGIGGEARFPLFNRKGYRGRPTQDVLVNKRSHHNMSDGSFCGFWISDSEGSGLNYACYIDRSGGRSITTASSCCGIRPKCRLKPDTKVELQEDGTYRVVPFSASKPHGSNVCTDEEFMSLMGLL